MKQINWMLPQTPVSKKDICSVTEILKQPLPDDFRLWLLKHNGAVPDSSELPLGNSNMLVINSFISFSQDDSPNIFSILELFKERLSDELLPIADDHGGNYVCYRFLENPAAPDIVLWDHEEADPKRAIVPVASSFTDLINRLKAVDA